ncbi:MAG: aspartyl protease family protein [Hyphomonadaceae bacterium]|nr:aspartyl protease family protein [Hyphomonadaceae bacterium]
MLAAVLTRILIAGLAWLAAGAAHAAECVSAPADETIADAAAGPTRVDRAGRVVAPVYVNGEGPFRFIVDTGANRSVISARLAERLGLVSSGEALVHSVHGSAPAPLVRVDALRYGALNFPGGEIPILGGSVMAGEHGLLGVDGMAGRRLLLDFRRGCIEIEPSREARRLRGNGWTSIRGELRFGHLVVVRARTEAMTVNVLIDTGSDTSLANTALLRAVNVRRGQPPTFAERVVSATESGALSDAVVLRRIAISDLEVENVVAYVGDYHIFSLWGLMDEPTLLLGMDVIARADAMAIDYGRATVHFRVTGRR